MVNDEWIDASGALAHVKAYAPAEQYRAAGVLANAAAVELIATRAARALRGQEKLDESVLPKEFWEAVGLHPMDHSWGLNSFDVWIEGRQAWQALGVQFHRGQLEAQFPLRVLSAKPSKEGRPRTDKWADWIAELAAYIHDTGIPSGVGSKGIDQVIDAIAERLAARGLDGPARSTVQTTVKAVLERLRSAGK